MDIKVGEYVRTDYGEILKVIKKEWYEREELWFYNSSKKPRWVLE